MFSETKTQESIECFKITKLKLHTKVQRTLIPLKIIFKISLQPRVSISVFISPICHEWMNIWNALAALSEAHWKDTG